jgi:hypothetical protein
MSGLGEDMGSIAYHGGRCGRIRGPPSPAPVAASRATNGVEGAPRVPLRAEKGAASGAPWHRSDAPWTRASAGGAYAADRTADPAARGGEIQP